MLKIIDKCGPVLVAMGVVMEFTIFCAAVHYLLHIRGL